MVITKQGSLDFYKADLMESTGVLRMTGLITDFAVWDDVIHVCVIKFHGKYNVYPNILEASELTFRKIELNAQRHAERIVSEETGETLNKSSLPFDGISNFVTEDYNLHFCLDAKLGEGSFRLIFDEAPDFGGEPMDEEEYEKPENPYIYKMSA